MKVNNLPRLIVSQEPEQQQAVFEVIEGGPQEALLSSQSPIPEADREDSEERPMEVMEAAKAVSSEAMTGDNGVVFGNGAVVVGGDEGDLNGGDDFILKTPADNADPSAELIKPEPVIQKATVDLLYDNEEPAAALKGPEDVVNDLLSGGNEFLLDTKNIGIHDQKELMDRFEKEVVDQFEVTNDQFEVKDDQFEVKDAALDVGDDPFKIVNQDVDVKEVPFEVKDEPSEVKDIPFEVKEESSKVKPDPFEESTEVNIVPKEVQSDLMEDKIDPLADFSAPTEVKQG